MKNLYQTVMAEANGATEFLQMLLREALLPELLGDDQGDISYWAGKSLARRFPIGNPKDASTFFKQAGFGDLALTKQTAQMTRWQLSGTPVKLRKQLRGDDDFTLEAGFLAQMMAQQLGVAAEAEITDTPRKLQATTITLDVYTDPEDVIPDFDAPTPLTVVRSADDQEPQAPTE